jgi:hypothetical protein
MQNEKQINDLDAKGENPPDLSRLFDYPSVGELFATADTRRYDEFCAKLSDTRQNLERIVRYGSREESERAQRAARAIEVTLEFLKNLQQMRREQQK